LKEVTIVRRKPNAPSDKKRKLALVIIEVARATNNGISLNQQGLKAEIRKQWRENIPNPTLSGYVAQLEGGSEYQRQWLRTDGHRVLLFVEDTTLMDSNAAKGLLLAQSMIDGNDCCGIDRWIDGCKEKHQFPAEDCRLYLQYFEECGYLHKREEGVVQLNMRSINQDMFYIRHLQKAGLRKRPRHLQVA